MVESPRAMHRTWCFIRHVQVGEYTIPFSRGCSFYRVNPQGEILFARDNVESTLKPGHLALRVSIKIA